MSSDAYESRTLPQSKFSALTTLFALLTWPIRWPFALLESRRENQAFNSGIDSAWEYCESVWDQPYVDAWCQLMHTPHRPYPPRPTFLLSRFARDFSHCHNFLLAKTRSNNPIIAAYAIMCMPNPNKLPIEVLERNEIIVLRDWFRETTMPLGKWANHQIDEFNRFNDLDDEPNPPMQTNAK